MATQPCQVALALLLHLGSAAVRLDVVTFSATMASLVRWSQALELLQLMEQQQVTELMYDAPSRFVCTGRDIYIYIL